MKLLSNLDLSQNELLNAVIQNLSGDVSSPEVGQLWFNTTSGKMKWFSGSVVIDPLARSNHTGTQAWSTLSGTPTTLAGYGITDAATTIDLSTKAPLSSPSLTGTPTAPTATAGTNTTQLATTAFVRGEVSAIVDAAPGTLDTLNELAAALGDDPNFATTVSTSIGTKAPLASPALTGTPTAPTAAPGTDTTQIATTAFVQDAIDAAGASGALKYAVDVGNGADTQITLTHNLGTRDVTVALRQTASPYAAAMTDWEATTDNTITLFFGSAPTTNEYRAVVLA